MPNGTQNAGNGGILLVLSAGLIITGMVLFISSPWGSTQGYSPMVCVNLLMQIALTVTPINIGLFGMLYFLAAGGSLRGCYDFRYMWGATSTIGIIFLVILAGVLVKATMNHGQFLGSMVDYFRTFNNVSWIVAIILMVVIILLTLLRYARKQHKP